MGSGAGGDGATKETCYGTRYKLSAAGRSDWASPPELGDVDAFLTLRNDLDSVGNLISFVRGVPRRKVTEWIAAIDNHDAIVLTAALRSDGRPIGYVQITDINGISGTCRIGVAIFSEADRGKGYGRRIVNLMLDYCRDWLNTRKINLIVLVDNEPAVALYKKCGFTVEGTLKDEHYLDGRYRTALLMARFLR